MDAAYQYTDADGIHLSAPLMMSRSMVWFVCAATGIYYFARAIVGKLITGIRVVDQTTHRLPSFTKLIGMCTFAVIYYL